MTTHDHPETPTSAIRQNLRDLLERVKLFGVDTNQLVESGRKDIEALLETNEKVFATAEALTHKQAELLTSLAHEWQASLKESVAKSGSAEKLTQASAHAQRAFATTLTSMKEMAEITAKSNQEVLALLNQRYHAAIEELRSSLRAKTPRSE